MKMLFASFDHMTTSFSAAFPPRRSEWFAAAVVFGMGWMLSINDGLLQTQGRVGYALMIQVATQEVWAMLLVLVGVVRLLVLFANGAWRRSPHARAFTAFASCFVWTQLALSFFPTFGFAFIMACGWLASDMVNILMAMRDARLVDDAYRASRKRGNQC